MGRVPKPRPGNRIGVRYLSRWFPVTLLGTLALLALWVSGKVLLELHDLTGRDVFGFDAVLLEVVRLRTPPILVPLLELTTEVFALRWLPALFTLGFLVLALLLRRGLWREAAGLSVAMLMGTLGVSAAKWFFQRERPDVPWALTQEPGFSFPSGHAALAVLVYGMAAYLLGRCGRSWLLGTAAALAAVALILLTGYSRVYLGAHYPTDVLAGFSAGFVWLAASIATTETLHLISPRERRERWLARLSEWWGRGAEREGPV